MGAISKDLLVGDPAIVLAGDSVISLLRDSAGATITAVSGRIQTVDAAVKVGNSVSSVADQAQAILAVRNDAGTTIATATGNYAPLQVDATGALRVAGNLSLASQYAEDTAHATSNLGLFNLGVRADVPTVATSADGDYAALTTDANNRMWINGSANVAIAASASTVTTTSALLYTAIPALRRVLVQNTSAGEIYIGQAGVTAVNGIRIPANGSSEFELGPSIALHAIAGSGSRIVKILQQA